MNRLTTAKVVLAVVGLIVFGIGIARDISQVRIAGIIIVGIGVMLRFFGRGDPGPPPDRME